MAVMAQRRQNTLSVGAQQGFTLIESVVAMGLFAGAVFMLITVFSSFTLDDYPSKTHEAFVIAQSVIARTERDGDFANFSKDTLDFRLRQNVQLKSGFAAINITVGCINNPTMTYTQLSDICLLR